MNAIEHVIIPRLENTIKYVLSELDEMDREEFFRFAIQSFIVEVAILINNFCAG